MQTKPTVDHSPATGFEFKPNPAMQEFFVEGVSEALIGFPISKLTFHTVEGISAEKKELRKGVCRVAIPTGALFEMCRNILAQGVVIAPHLEAIFKQGRAQVESVLTDVHVTPTLPPDHLTK